MEEIAATVAEFPSLAARLCLNAYYPQFHFERCLRVNIADFSVDNPVLAFGDATLRFKVASDSDGLVYWTLTQPDGMDVRRDSLSLLLRKLREESIPEEDFPKALKELSWLEQEGSRASKVKLSDSFPLTDSTPIAAGYFYRTAAGYVEDGDTLLEVLSLACPRGENFWFGQHKLTELRNEMINYPENDEKKAKVRKKYRDLLFSQQGFRRISDFDPDGFLADLDERHWGFLFLDQTGGSIEQEAMFDDTLHPVYLEFPGTKFNPAEDEVLLLLVDRQASTLLRALPLLLTWASRQLLGEKVEFYPLKPSKKQKISLPTEHLKFYRKISDAGFNQLSLTVKTDKDGLMKEVCPKLKWR
ncbi:hypothetical protein BK816_00720 [Boudabousia tangfeifanii]|uniref:Uncharacterized protein n=1 Tax=Boudabousia tangfeifanii TaxID=1912795 RepID=A0A1D9MIH6_9ACTO|nr:hypothetical protein [Boudabousia tangfeifanii]AOZ71999.1 hypothetical protein BK816_00720 [Boudabousia tangfeifanii]